MVSSQDWKNEKMAPVQQSHHLEKEFTFSCQPAITEAVTEQILLERIRCLPRRVNWVEQGVVGPVVNQGFSWHCWAYQIVNELNAMFLLATGRSYRFSVQKLVDSDAGNYPSISRGSIFKRMLGFNRTRSGNLVAALSWVSEHGLCLKKDYRSISLPRFFRRDKNTTTTTFKISGYATVPCFREDYLKLAVACHPVLVRLKIMHRNFYNYKEGIYTQSEHPEDLLSRHAVLLVGYGAINGRKVWCIQNCWGSKWGMGGYMLLPRDVDNPYENCYLAQYPVYPIIPSFNCDLFKDCKQ